jgi:hypothetical protein
MNYTSKVEIIFPTFGNSNKDFEWLLNIILGIKK